MIFPNLKNKTFGYLNLNLEAQTWYKEKDLKDTGNESVLIDPKKCQQFIDDTHEKYNLDFSYGGWMEDRSFIWKGGYLEKDKKFNHLGIYINVPSGTEICADFKAEVVKTDDDYPLDGGWGPHVILKHLSKPIYILYAHLEEKNLCKIGDILESNTIFAKVGHAPINGNWFPHVHIQTISPDYYDYLEKNNGWENFDGYGFLNNIKSDSIKHIDPLNFIKIQ